MSYERLGYLLDAGETVDASASANTLTSTLTRASYVDHVLVQYTSTSTVGNRTVAIEILDGADAVVATHFVDLIQIASLFRTYIVGYNAPSEAAFVSGQAQRPIQIYRIPAGWKIRARDTAGIDSSDSIRMVISLRPVYTGL